MSGNRILSHGKTNDEDENANRTMIDYICATRVVSNRLVTYVTDKYHIYLSVDFMP